MSLLLHEYDKFDHFDLCGVAVEKAKSAFKGSKAFGYSDQASMQEFKWLFSYSGIFMVWCAGYLKDEELVTFLHKA